jgi:hypothetical protein
MSNVKYDNLGKPIYKNVKDDPLFDQFIADQDYMIEDGTVRKAVEVAKHKSKFGYDTWVGKRDSQVCADACRNIYKDAGIAMPETNSLATMMDALEGLPVQLYNNPVNEKGARVSQVWEGSKDWLSIENPGEIKPGDFMVVHNDTQGMHGVFVSNIAGNPDNRNFFKGYFSGVDIVHDPGSNERVQSSHYEWAELYEGHPESEDLDRQINRKFVRAFRYIGGQNG